MNRLKRYSLRAAMLVAGASLTATALSHNPLDDPDWCQGSSTTVIVAEFDWSGYAIIQSDIAPVCSTSTRGETPPGGSCDIIPPTHGQFDDDWRNVKTKIDLFCARFEMTFAGSSNPDHGSVVGIVTGPRDFTNEQSHHELYSRSQGVQGACVRCEPMVVAPPLSPSR